MVEYCLRYLQSESRGKPQIDYEDFATMISKNDIEKLSLDLNGLNMFLMKKNFKITDFTGAGFCQLIYDINFITFFYVMKLRGSKEDKSQIDPSYEVNPNKLIEKFFKIYCREYLRNPKEFAFDFQLQKQSFSDYLALEYPKFCAEKEKQVGNDSMLSSKSSLVSNFSFGKILE